MKVIGISVTSVNVQEQDKQVPTAQTEQEHTSWRSNTASVVNLSVMEPLTFN